MADALRPCCARFPCGERALAGSRYCAAHKPKAIGSHARRDPAKQKIYNSARWRKLRRMKLGRQPICELELPGCQRGATEVHHRVALEDGGSPWSFENMISSCKACHSRMTQQERRNRPPGSSTPGSAAGGDKPKPTRKRLMGIPLEPDDEGD